MTAQLIIYNKIGIRVEDLGEFSFCIKFEFFILIQLKSEILISVQIKIGISDFIIKNFNK